MSLKQSQVPTTIIYTSKNGYKEVFIRYEELGHGGLATVYRVKHQNTNKIYAMKVISKQLLRSKGQFAIKKLKDEIHIQKKLNHPNVLSSKLTFSDKLFYYIVLEYCPGQSIREYLKKSANGYLTEPETKKILRDVIHGLIYLHNHKIIHHDLKLENFIIDSQGRVNISDFGLADVFKDVDKDEDENQSLICGTVNYLSPEIVNRKKIGFESDVWAIGVATFIMLTGKPPFEGPNNDIIFDKIRDCDYQFPLKIQISADAKNFIRAILQVKPLKRPRTEELLYFPFLSKMDKEQVELYKPENETEVNEQPSSPIDSINQVHSSSPNQNGLQDPVQTYTKSNQENPNNSLASSNNEKSNPKEMVKSILKKIKLRRQHHKSNRKKLNTSDSEIPI